MRPDILLTSRLSLVTALGALSGVIPLPFLPDTVQRRLRGALVHDVATRRGLSLTPDAREALARVGGSEATSRFVSGAAGYVARRFMRGRVGPLAFFAPVRAGVETFALGLLFERYLASSRRGPSVRIHATEARAVREAIDRAILRAFVPSTAPSEAAITTAPPEDLRDDTTRLVDSFVLGAATVPEYLVRRLEGAFDAVIVDHPELVDG